MDCGLSFSIYLLFKRSHDLHSHFNIRLQMAHFVLATIQMPCVETLERTNCNKTVLKHILAHS